jgi:hypothetical protein
LKCRRHRRQIAFLRNWKLHWLLMVTVGNLWQDGGQFESTVHGFTENNEKHETF